MSEQTNNNETAMQANQAVSIEKQIALDYLKSLKIDYNRSVLKCVPRDRDSRIIDPNIAQTFTTSFRTTQAPFNIPVSWTMTKTALVSLLGITDYEDFSGINGIRFYAGVNCDNQLTLVAVSTEAGNGCNEDLTQDDNYPYYDFADPCPTNCSNNGNLKATDAVSLKVIVTQ